MSEKRFEVDVDHLLLVWDAEKNKRLEIEDIVGLLNEQQAIIEYLTIEKHQADKRFQTIIAELKKENEQLRQKILITETRIE